MTNQTIKFKAQVGKVLDIVIHSLYSNKEIFLRELISNAADASDKLRYALLIHPELSTTVKPFKIVITPDKASKTLTISDGGIGMDEDDLINHLGTIAKSGSAEFISALTGDRKKDMALIGQFGVGFYASFMVADKVDVRTKKAGTEKGYLWQSSGVESFSIEEIDKPDIGTDITLYLKEGMDEYLEPIRLRHLVRQYADFIELPIELNIDGKSEVVNSSSALWTKPKAEITAEQYKTFYQSLSGAFDAPWLKLHYTAEGIIDYTALLFIPEKAPFNLFQVEFKSGLQLYVNKVFISNDIPELLPHFLRFVSGVIDTKDLPLNVSREMLQQTPVLSKIRSAITKKMLAEIKKRSENAADYALFWQSFGIVFKEGLYEPGEDTSSIAPLCRFNHLKDNDLISFDTYIENMADGQENIYYITGQDVNHLKNNPQLEGFADKNIDVLLLTDPIDEFWIQTFTQYKGKNITSVMHAKQDVADTAQSSIDESKINALTKRFKAILREKVLEIKPTNRLTKSPVALITPAGQMSLNLERMMKANNQEIARQSARILEINPSHPLIIKLADLIAINAQENKIENAILTLYDQALLAEGETLPNPADFTRRLNDFMLDHFTAK